MKAGDLLLFYHSNEGKEIVGIAKVARTAYADATAEEGDWSAVDVAPVQTAGRACAPRDDPRGLPEAPAGMLLLCAARGGYPGYRARSRPPNSSACSSSARPSSDAPCRTRAEAEQ